MEVHTHTHTERKKFKHYLWEFLMLFLAVFCGFLAENFREHQIEKERGRQYIISFSEDLKTDTAQFTSLVHELTGMEASLSNIFNCFDTVSQKPKSTDCLKQIIKNSEGFTDFVYTDRTIEQLKYAGGLRLIHDKEIADSIIKYDAAVRHELIHQNTMENEQQIVISAHNEMIGFMQLHNLKKTDFKNGLFLLTTDTRELNKYFNKIFLFRRGCLSQLHYIKDLKAMATRLLIFLNKKGY